MESSSLLRPAVLVPIVAVAVILLGAYDGMDVGAIDAP